MRAIVVTDPVRKSLNIIENENDDPGSPYYKGKAPVRAKVKPFVPCPKHVAVDCGDKPGQRRVVLAPVAALGIGGFPGLYV